MVSALYTIRTRCRSPLRRSGVAATTTPSLPLRTTSPTGSRMSRMSADAWGVETPMSTRQVANNLAARTLTLMTLITLSTAGSPARGVAPVPIP
jgi:hypothetical protein